MYSGNIITISGIHENPELFGEYINILLIMDSIGLTSMALVSVSVLTIQHKQYSCISLFYVSVFIQIFFSALDTCWQCLASSRFLSRCLQAAVKQNLALARQGLSLHGITFYHGYQIKCLSHDHDRPDPVGRTSKHVWLTRS